MEKKVKKIVIDKIKFDTKLSLIILNTKTIWPKYGQISVSSLKMPQREFNYQVNESNELVIAAKQLKEYILPGDLIQFRIVFEKEKTRYEYLLITAETIDAVKLKKAMVTDFELIDLHGWQHEYFDNSILFTDNTLLTITNIKNIQLKATKIGVELAHSSWLFKHSAGVITGFLGNGPSRKIINVKAMLPQLIFEIEQDDLKNWPRILRRILGLNLQINKFNIDINFRISDSQLPNYQLIEQKRIDIKETKKDLVSVSIQKDYLATKLNHQLKTMVFSIDKTLTGKTQLTMNVSAKDHFEISKVVMQLRSDLFTHSVELLITKQKKLKGNGTAWQVKALLMMDWQEFYSLYWDLYLLLDFGVGLERVKVDKVGQRVQRRITRNYLKYSLVNQANNQIVAPYITYGKELAFMIRDMEAVETKGAMLNQKLAEFYFRLTKRLPFNSKKIWLGFEKFSMTAQDNGYAFFDYVMQNNLYPDFYYVLSKASPDYHKVKEKYPKKLLVHGTFKYYLYLLRSEKLIGSEIRRHVYSLRIRSGYMYNIIKSKQAIFLQHGVTAFKKTDYFKNTPNRGGFDLVIATSDNERRIIHDYWNYPNDKIATTGFSRWDLLVDKSQQNTMKSIFVMPTWRTWLEDLPGEDFKLTEYFQRYESLLKNPQILAFLQKNNMKLVFFLHPKFKDYIDNFTTIDQKHYVIYKFGDVLVNEEIMKASLMITDYSSVAWDMFYMKKPVIFYQFDVSRYLETWGSYLDMDQELFGLRATNNVELLAAMEKNLVNNFKLTDHQLMLHRQYFIANDHANSARILAAINALNHSKDDDKLEDNKHV
ncbi:CDP-glycerol glycerophosphotransferase (TagB/SpsB family) [Weissella beninensis]|uniref:CDP-glycerol glycerophosphotransferase family protein n=1 Tax=Periweissella beninensis TaxID=504936 RepID=A0ABT0VGQ1_9LACO|nr:CDP-glycerol glycerophosphotransferase family protein [Periweissella beninensis]MBM7544774.1 CDP-glycerol glycerophosphotransferase (TagB/SpsB family) [Periweissella beninensis]MCM2437012.1 CDP-glycerol glycerophosphotransferase family protein [Periweissella beninensis]